MTKLDTSIPIKTISELEALIATRSLTDVYILELGLIITCKHPPTTNTISTNDNFKPKAKGFYEEYYQHSHYFVLYKDPDLKILEALQNNNKSNSILNDLILYIKNAIKTLSKSNTDFWKDAGGFYFYDSSGTMSTTAISVRETNAKAEKIDIAVLNSINSYASIGNITSPKNHLEITKNIKQGLEIGMNIGKRISPNKKNKLEKDPPKYNQKEETLYGLTYRLPIKAHELGNNIMIEDTYNDTLVYLKDYDYLNHYLNWTKYNKKRKELIDDLEKNKK